MSGLELHNALLYPPADSLDNKPPAMGALMPWVWHTGGSNPTGSLILTNCTIFTMCSTVAAFQAVASARGWETHRVRHNVGTV